MFVFCVCRWCCNRFIHFVVTYCRHHTVTRCKHTMPSFTYVRCVCDKLWTNFERSLTHWFALEYFTTAINHRHLATCLAVFLFTRQFNSSGAHALLNNVCIGIFQYNRLQCVIARLTLNWHRSNDDGTCSSLSLFCRTLYNRPFSGHSEGFISFAPFNRQFKKHSSKFALHHLTIDCHYSLNSLEDYQKKNRRLIKFEDTFAIESMAFFCSPGISCISNGKTSSNKYQNKKKLKKSA